MERWEENLDVVHGKRNRLDLRIDDFVFWIFNFNQPWKPEIWFCLKIQTFTAQRLASFGAVGAGQFWSSKNAKQHNMSLNPNVLWRRGPGYWNIIRFSRDPKKSGKWMKDFGGSSWSYCPFLLLWFTFQPLSSSTLGPGCSSASLLSPAQSKQWKDHIWNCDVEKK